MDISCGKLSERLIQTGFSIRIIIKTSKVLPNNFYPDFQKLRNVKSIFEAQCKKAQCKKAQCSSYYHNIYSASCMHLFNKD